MEWLNIISNTDSVIHDICITDSSLIVNIRLWDQTIKHLRFLNYYIFKEQRSMGEEIGDVKIQANSLTLDELKQNILNGDGKLTKLPVLKVYCFITHGMTE